MRTEARRKNRWKQLRYGGWFYKGSESQIEIKLRSQGLSQRVIDFDFRETHPTNYPITWETHPTDYPITWETHPTNYPITWETYPTNYPITLETHPTNYPITWETHPTNYPITQLPNYPITCHHS
jgi:hypothetical protein